MNAYNNRNHEQKRWKQHRMMQAIAKQDKERWRANQRAAENLFDNILSTVVRECQDPNCAIHGKKARANTN